MYPEGETLALAVLRTVTGFTGSTSTTENTSRGKWGILNSGNSDHYGILKPGTFKRGQSAMSANTTTFQTVIEVWQRYVDDGSSLTNLEGYVKAIINVFDQKRKLGDSTGTIMESFITDGREVTQQWNKDGALVWLKQDLILEWQEFEEVAYAE